MHINSCGVNVFVFRNLFLRLRDRIYFTWNFTRSKIISYLQRVTGQHFHENDFHLQCAPPFHFFPICDKRRSILASIEFSFSSVWRRLPLSSSSALFNIFISSAVRAVRELLLLLALPVLLALRRSLSRALLLLVLFNEPRADSLGVP